MKLFVFYIILLSFAAETTTNNATVTHGSCETSIQTGNYPKALQVCNRALDQADKNEKTTARIYLQLATIHHELGNKDDESYYLAKIKSHPRFIEDIKIQYEWHRKVGQKYYFSAQYEAAKNNLYQALTVAEKEDQPLWLSKSHNDMGLVEFKLANFKAALLHYQKSLELKKKHGNNYQIGKTLNNLGLIHFKLELFPEAVAYYENAISHYLNYSEQDHFDERVFYDIAHIYEDLNRAYSANNNPQKAGEYAEAIMTSLKLKISPQEQTRALLNLAMWHSKKNHFKLSQLFLNEANGLLANQGNNELKAQFYFLSSELNLNQGQTQLAETNALTGLSLAKSLENDLLITDAYELLGHIYQSSDPTKALDAMQQYQAYREAFLKKKYDSDLRSVQHEIEKQQIEQKLLNQELTNIEQQHQLQQLTNLVLWAVIFLVLVIAILIIYHIKRKKEKEDLIKAIHYHKQQLILLEATQNQTESEQSENDPSRFKIQLKEQLVTAMIDAVNIWEKNTQTTQIDLAEQSKIWTVSVDNGTLRTRSLDKYLSIDKIPQNPRWRNVVKTCHFILSHDQLNSQDRGELNNHLERIMDTVRNVSLSNS
ncbi:tetratricopeptide repeat protein [Marinicella rhabdoformis]|uniref:tetratricopeptide repeat protein n=1 Tax=Marinicella rhabdoformis TaxID=2580566 RepID=UPI0012AED472|nr:tetratricopeptide repeat protein [Marinicella rhabdoformis]